MRARKISMGLGAAMTAAGLVAAVPAAASAETAAAPETFTVIVAGNAPQVFVAHGALDATGTAIPLPGGGPSGGSDTVELPGGSFMLTLVNSSSGGGGSSNPVTCVDTFYGHGTSTISDGTGRYAGIEGTGTFTFDGAFIRAHIPQGGCSQQGTIVDLVQDQGTVSLP